MVDKLYFRRLFYRNGVTNTTPFTYRDGVTFLEILQEIKCKIVKEILPSIEGLDEELKEQINRINDNFEALDRQWTEQLDSVDAALIQEMVNGMRSDMTDLESGVNAVVAAVNADNAAMRSEMSQLSTTLTDRVNAVETSSTAALNTFRGEYNTWKNSVTSNLSSINNKITTTNNAINTKDAAVRSDIVEALKTVNLNFPKASNTLLVLGDSYGTGCQENGTPYITPMGEIIRSYLQADSNGQTWTVKNMCVDNSGYYTPGQSKNFVQQLQQAIADGVSNVKICVILGGRNDRGRNVRSDVNQCCNQIRSAFPGVKIIVFPMWSWERLDYDYKRTFESIYEGAKNARAMYDEGSLFVNMGEAKASWSGVHPSDNLTRNFARGVVKLIYGGTISTTIRKGLVGETLMGNFHASVTANLTHINLEVAGNFPHNAMTEPEFGRLPELSWAPNRTLYLPTMGGSGANSFITVITPEGRIFGRGQLSNQNAGDYMQLITSWHIGMEP